MKQRLRDDPFDSIPAKNPGKIFYALAVFDQAEKDAVREALDAGLLGAGPIVARFETRIAERFGKRFGVAVNSGSSANLLALAALNVPPGSEVIAPATTFATAFAPIVQLGLRPVVVDSEAATYQVDLNLLEAAITSRTSAVFVPQLIGNACDLARLRALCDAHGLALLDDSCDAIGTSIHGQSSGRYSDVTTTSFYASHVITAGGMGGMIMTDSEEIRDRAVCLRDWGRVGNDREHFDSRFGFELDGVPYDAKFLYTHLGYNMKLPEINAAFGLAQEAKLDRFLAVRRRNFEHLVGRMRTYEEHLVLPRSHPGVEAQWLAAPFTLRPNGITRYDLLRHLESHGVQTRVIFSGNIARHPAFRPHLTVDPGSFRVADGIMARGFLLGAHHGLSDEDVTRLADSVDDFFATVRS